jgi:hypothetical protein
MLGKKKQQLGNLKIEWAELEWEIAEAKVSDADPDVKSYHLGELQCIQIAIEEQIDALEHDIAMFPLKLMLGGFIVFTVGLFIYYFQKL